MPIRKAPSLSLILVTAIAASLAVTGCDKKGGEAPKKAASKAPAKPPAKKKAPPKKAAEAPAKKTAEAPAKPSGAPPEAAPSLPPLPWPPADIKAPATDATCQSLCAAEAKGDFFQKCPCKGKGIESPLAARRTSKYNDFFEGFKFDVINRSDRPVSWASLALYYYDANGKQLTAVVEDKDGKRPPRSYKLYEVNGSNFTVPANTTKQLTLGWSKEVEPKGTARVEAVFGGWCYGEDSKDPNRLCIFAGKPPEERPMTK